MEDFFCLVGFPFQKICEFGNKLFSFVAVPVIYIYMAIWRARLQANILHPGISLPKTINANLTSSLPYQHLDILRETQSINNE